MDHTYFAVLLLGNGNLTESTIVKNSGNRFLLVFDSDLKNYILWEMLI